MSHTYRNTSSSAVAVIGVGSVEPGATITSEEPIVCAYLEPVSAPTPVATPPPPPPPPVSSEPADEPNE